MSFQWKLPYNFHQIQNIKLLNKYKSDIKYLIKRNNCKIKRFNDIIIKSNNELEKTIKKLNKRIRSNNNKKKFICEVCCEKTLSQNNFKAHKCGSYHYSEEIIDKPTRKLKEEVNDLRDEIHYKSINIKMTEDENDFLNIQLYKVITRVEEISMVCQKCKKNTDCVDACSCSYNHNLCSLCIKDTDKCPLCREILNHEKCPICLEERKNIIDVNCGNNHRICKKCINTVLDTNPKCPFCRVYIK